MEFIISLVLEEGRGGNAFLCANVVTDHNHCNATSKKSKKPVLLEPSSFFFSALLLLFQLLLKLNLFQILGVLRRACDQVIWIHTDW